jgi:hypothetical protein
MKKAVIILLASTILLVISCKDDLDVAPYKHITIVYGLINIKDTVQYVRINRGFSTQGDPYEVTMINDSVNYPHDIFEVFLEEYRNGEMVGDPVPYEAVDRQKEPGLFSNESNCVYRTEVPIHKDCEYKLRVIEKETGREIWGEAGVLGNVTMEEAFGWERSFYRVDYYAEPLQTDYDGSLDPSEHKHYIMRFLYWEYADGETYHKYVDWIPSIDQAKAIADDDTTLQLFDEYYEYLASQIPVNANVKRRARGVDYMLALPGPELQTYSVVYEQPTNPHFFPQYSNMSNDRGVFSSKYFYTYFGLKFKKRTVDTISWGRHLYYHRFADSKGEWH